jgi:hypothetical protein
MLLGVNATTVWRVVVDTMEDLLITVPRLCPSSSVAPESWHIMAGTATIFITGQA